MAARQRKRMGRPPLPPDERRVHLVQAKLTHAEYRALREAAADEPLGTLLRLLVLDYLTNRESITTQSQPRRRKSS